MDLYGPNVHKVAWLLMMITYRTFLYSKEKGEKKKMKIIKRSQNNDMVHNQM